MAELMQRRKMPPTIPDWTYDQTDERCGWRSGCNFLPRTDKTSDDGDREHAARCDEIRTRQWRELDASTVGDIAHDERLAECLRTGAAPAAVGMLLLGLVNERIDAIVRSAS